MEARAKGDVPARLQRPGYSIETKTDTAEKMTASKKRR